MPRQAKLELMDDSWRMAGRHKAPPTKCCTIMACVLGHVEMKKSMNSSLVQERPSCFMPSLAPFSHSRSADARSHGLL